MCLYSNKSAYLENGETSNVSVNPSHVAGNDKDNSHSNPPQHNKNDTVDPIMTKLKVTRANNGKNLIFLHVNINSIKEKYENIDDILVKRYADVMCITESKLSKTYLDSEFKCQGFKLYRKDKASNSGGMMVWVRSDIPQERQHQMEIVSYNHHIENMVIKLTIRKQKWYILVIYKNPKVAHQTFIDLFSNLIDKVQADAQEIIIMGDVNIDMQKKNDLMTTDICNIYGMRNMIKQPTCFKKPEGTLIDPVIVLNAGRFQSPLNMHCGYSDFHNMVGCVTKIHMPPQEPVRKTYRNYKEFEEVVFKEDIQQIPFHVSEVFDDPSDRYWAMGKMYTDVLDQHAPYKTRTIKCKQVPYMHSELRKQMYKRNMAKNRYFKNKTPHLRKQYVTIRNAVSIMRRDAIKSYFLSKCKDKCKPKDFYDCIRPFMTGNDNTHSNIILKEEDRIVTDKMEICDIFNNFFSTVADDIGSPDSIPIESADYYDKTLNKHKDHPSIKAINNLNIQSEFNFQSIETSAIEKLLSHINVNKATGHDNIPGRTVKMCSKELAQTLSSIFNECIKTNTFPDDMKKAEITPVFKKKNDMMKDNYRPVSVLDTLAKTFETIMGNQLAM